MNNISDYELMNLYSSSTYIAIVLDINSDLSSNQFLDKEKTIKVYIPSLMSKIEMDIKEPLDKQTPIDTSIILNKNFKISKQSITSSNYIEVPPFRISNIEQPKVYYGESIWIIAIDKDFKKFKYIPFFMNEKKRTFDRFRTFISDRTENSSDYKEYEILMDSAERKIRMQMQTGRNEVSVYTIDIDGKEGYIKINDDEGNEIGLKTNDHHTWIKNVDGSIVEVINNDCNVTTSNTINETTSTKNENASTINENADSINESASTINNTADKININGGMVNVKGTKVIISAPMVQIASPSIILGGGGGGGGGGGSQGVPFGGLLKEYLDSHTHPTPEGESGPPSQSSPSPSSGVTMT